MYFERGISIMFTRKIVIDTVEKVQTLVGAATAAPFDVDIVNKTFIVNAKSIMGLFSIDRSNPITITANADEGSEEAMAFFDKIGDLIV